MRGEKGKQGHHRRVRRGRIYVMRGDEGDHVCKEEQGPPRGGESTW